MLWTFKNRLFNNFQSKFWFWPKKNVTFCNFSLNYKEMLARLMHSDSWLVSIKIEWQNKCIGVYFCASTHKKRTYNITFLCLGPHNKKIWVIKCVLPKNCRMYYCTALLLLKSFLYMYLLLMNQINKKEIHIMKN